MPNHPEIIFNQQKPENPNSMEEAKEHPEKETSKTSLKELLNQQGRLIGIDLGRKKVGLAISDELKMTARGLKVVMRQKLVPELESLLKTYPSTKGFVLGLAKSQSGQAEKLTKDFASQLERKFKLAVFFQDERLTSWDARQLLKEDNLNSKQIAQQEDQKAAELILQSFLDSLQRV